MRPGVAPSGLEKADPQGSHRPDSLLLAPHLSEMVAQSHLNLGRWQLDVIAATTGNVNDRFAPGGMCATRRFSGY
jgi:hypothetical protein